MNGVEGIFSKMRALQYEEEQEVKNDPMTEEQSEEMNEENMDEMSRDEEKSVIKKARPIVQKIAYANDVKVKNPGQNTNRFILVGENARKAAKEAADAVKEALKEVGGFEDLRIKAAGVASKDKEKYKIEGPCMAVIVDVPGSVSEEDLDETQGLEINKKATNGKAFTVEINGKKYSYYPTEESGLTAKELGQKYSKIAQYSKGKALSWLKKNATTPDSYHKAANEEILDEAKKVEEPESDDKEDTPDETLSTSGNNCVIRDGKKFKVVMDGEVVKAFDTEEDAYEHLDELIHDQDDSDEETCPVCGKKHKKGEKCCEEKDSVNEEIAELRSRLEALESGKQEDSVNEEVDVAELAARLDECEGSDYMKKALEDGKYELVQKYLFLKEE